MSNNRPYYPNRYYPERRIEPVRDNLLFIVIALIAGVVLGSLLVYSIMMSVRGSGTDYKNNESYYVEHDEKGRLKEIVIKRDAKTR